MPNLNRCWVNIPKGYQFYDPIALCPMTLNNCIFQILSLCNPYHHTFFLFLEMIKSRYAVPMIIPTTNTNGIVNARATLLFSINSTTCSQFQYRDFFQLDRLLQYVFGILSSCTVNPTVWDYKPAVCTARYAHIIHFILSHILSIISIL